MPEQTVHGRPVEDRHRPWLAQKRGETNLQWQERVSHSCWRCGHYEADLDVLDAHEDSH